VTSGTIRPEAEPAHRDSPSFATAVLDALPDATAILDRFGRITAVNRVWRMYSLDNGGRPETNGVGVSYLDVCARSARAGCVDAAEVLAGLRAVLAGETIESDHDYPCPSPVGGRWFTTRITPIQSSTGGAVVSHVNISRRKISEDELSHQASHDPLTGLANRLLFTSRLSDALGPNGDHHRGGQVGLLYIDLDNFKPVNDSYGHDAGDEVLITVAHRLRGQVRDLDTAARLGGDEFAVCAPGLAREGLHALAERIRVALAVPHQIHGRQTLVPGSIGAHLASSGDTVADALRLADQAMYAIKNARFEGGGETPADQVGRLRSPARR
jgi:diguanylate cyclase (GGDEF)-like protein